MSDFDAKIDDAIQLFGTVVDTLVRVIGGLRQTALVFAIGAVVGGLLFWIGLAATFGPWWLGLFPALATLIPAFGLYKLRNALTPSLDLADNFRAAAPNREALSDSILGEAQSILDELGDVKEIPRNPVAFWKTARTAKSAIDSFQASSVGQLTTGTMALHPAVLIPGGIACLWAGAAFVCGATVFALAIIF